MATITELKAISSQVRRDIIRMTAAAQSGHPGGSLSSTEIMVALYFELMNINPQNFTREGKNEDMFFLSIGHVTPVFYSVLAHRGYFPTKELATFRKLGSRLQGHPSVSHNLPGVRVASGSLGQGLSVAIGAALTKKLNADKSLVFTLHGDGELQEGQIWEAVMFAAAKKVDNLVAVVDYNKVQIDGSNEEVCSLGNLKDKFLAFGWRVLECAGNDMESVVTCLNVAKTLTGKGNPVIILADTQMGYGVDFMCGKNSWHGSAPSQEQAEAALSQLEETLGDF
ncbi:MAG: transketolase [Bacteroidales bacterium]|jgi:transketolase|nr:transketolase [Bacteroidales bacterium]